MKLIHVILKISARNGFIALFAKCNISGAVDYMHLVISGRNLTTAEKYFNVKKYFNVPIKKKSVDTAINKNICGDFLKVDLMRIGGKKKMLKSFKVVCCGRPRLVAKASYDA